MIHGILRAALVLALGAGPLFAAPQAGYVVKVDGKKVFLDLMRSNGAAPGKEFTVFTEGESLKHPVSGADLGKIEKTVASGRILEVHEKYSLGELTAPAEVAPGQKVRLSDFMKTPAPEPEPGPQGKAGSPTRAPYYRSPLLAIEAVDLALGDVDGDGAADVVVAGAKGVRAYPVKQDDAPWAPNCSFDDESTGPQFLSVETADLDKDGRQEVFVTLNNTFFKRVETYALACKDGKFAKVETFPWMVRSYSDLGRPTLATQQLVDDGSFPTSSIFKLEHAEGKYAPSKERIKHKRLDWVYGFGLAGLAEQPFPVFYSKANRIVVQQSKGSWSSPETYGQTAARLRWHDKPFQFHPRLILENGPKGFEGVYAVKSIPRYGSLSEPFGLFSRSELHYLRWNGLGLDPVWSAELSGYAAGLAARYAEDGRPAELVTAVVGGAGGTSIWFFRTDNGFGTGASDNEGKRRADGVRAP